MNNISDISMEKVAKNACEQNSGSGAKSVRFYTKSTYNAQEINAAERNGIGKVDWEHKNERKGRIVWHRDEIKVFLSERRLAENMWLYRGTLLLYFSDAVFENKDEQFDFLRYCRNFNDETINKRWEGKIVTYKQFVL